MRMDKEQADKRANSKKEMQRKNAEYEIKVAMAAKAISRDRDMEKDKLTKINIDKTKAKHDKLFMQQHLQKEVQKNQTSKMLQAELQSQINQKRETVYIQAQFDQAQLLTSKIADQAHWDNEQRV